MSKRDISQEILDGIREIKEHKAGKKALRVHTLLIKQAVYMNIQQPVKQVNKHTKVARLLKKGGTNGK